MRAKRISCRLALVFLLGTPLSFGAEPSVRTALQADARARFDEGTRLYRTKKLVDAREAFLAAFSSSNEPRVLFNVAVCEKALGRYARAIATIERSLRLVDRSLHPDYVERATASIEALGKYVAKVQLNANVGDVSFIVDGELVTDNPVVLESGEHVVQAKKEGFDSVSKKVAVTAGEPQTATFELSRMSQASSVTVDCDGPSEKACVIEISGENLGPAPVTFSRPPGAYVVRASRGGRPYAQERIVVTAGKAERVVVAGHLLPKLRVTSDGPTDTVLVDGLVVGTSGTEVELFPGEHRLTVTRASGATRSMEIALQDRETRNIQLTLTEDKASGGISAWWFVGGAALLAGAAATTVYLATQPTRYEGSRAGSLNPFVVTAGFSRGM